MTASWRALVIVLVVLWPLPASAQPLVETEHDWRVTIGEGSYGVRQVVVRPGDIRQTTIHFGSHVYHTRLRAVEIAALALGPVVLAAAVAMSRWRRKASGEGNSAVKT